ncbi:MAG: hypothetical protein ACE5KG_03700 [Nitrososphaerales archaeon]
MQNLEALRKKLLFNTTLDVWIALSEDTSREWFDPIAYEKFIEFLGERKVSLLPVSVMDESGRKSEFMERGSEILGRSPSKFNLRLDETVMKVILEFQP